MENSTESGNHTKIQGFSCTTGLYGFRLKILVSAFNIALSITAFVGNILIIAALQKMTTIHPPSRLLLRCLATTDLGVGLITQPMFVSFLMSSENTKYCFYLLILFYNLGGIFGLVSFLTMTAIAVDRHVALMLRLRYRQVVTLRRIWVLVFVIWFFSTIVMMALYYDLRLTSGILCIILLLSLVTSTVCYTKIYHKLRHHHTQVHDHVRGQEQPSEGGVISLNIARYRRTVSSAAWVQMTLVVCYLPFAIAVATFAITGLRSPAYHLALDLTISIVLLNSTLNPFLYCWKLTEVRQAVKDTIRQLFCSSSLST